MSDDAQDVVEPGVMQAMVLSVDEVSIIRERRFMKAEQEAARCFQQKAIAIAAEFSCWISAHSADFSYETFVESFGYQEDDGNLMFAAVQRIYAAAKPVASNRRIIATGVAVRDTTGDGSLWPSQFLVWLRKGLSSGSLSINTKASLVHRVPEGVFLLAPNIFKVFAEQHKLPEDSHRQLSRRLARLRCHIRSGDLNIHSYVLNRLDRDIKLNGWLFPVGMFFNEENPAPDINHRLIRLSVSEMK